ncbi:MAG: higA [Verrucomicrobiales bacterium]|jgi:addiction module HigA family antidote|nr:higA [Verrucomicrobiales bacterium]
MINGGSAFIGKKGMLTRLKLSTTINIMNISRHKLPPVHPGEILLEEFLIPMGISQYALAKALSVGPIAISQIVKGNRSVSPEMALKLSAFFGVSAEMWTGIQSQYDLEVIRHKIQDSLLKIKSLRQKAIDLGNTAKAA